MRNQRTGAECLTCIHLSYAVLLRRRNNVRKEKVVFTATHVSRSSTIPISTKLSSVKATCRTLGCVTTESTARLRTTSLKLALTWLASLHLTPIFIFFITKQCGVRLLTRSTSERHASMPTIGKILDGSRTWSAIQAKFATNGTYRKRLMFTRTPALLGSNALQAMAGMRANITPRSTRKLSAHKARRIRPAPQHTAICIMKDEGIK